MDTSAISGTSSASTYVATTGGATSSTDFASILASQTAGGDGAAGASGASPGDEALKSYSAGQVTAYALQSEASSGEAAETAEAAAGSGEAEATGETQESTETEASSGGAGFPAEPGSEWTPSHMQFYDAVYGRWVDDNIPHRINENGDLEYQFEGEWYLDVAVRHRLLDESGNVLAYMDENGNPIQEGEELALAAEGEGSEGEGSEALSFQVDEYFNEVLQAWKVFNFPSRVSDDGQREYYWADAWHVDNWQHRLGGSTTEVASNSESTEESGESTTETGASEDTTAQAA